jgi:hypothetical protein
MELARMAIGRGLSNYRPPYVEDYESEYDEMERLRDEMHLINFLERGGGMMHPGMFGDYMYGDDFGDLGGRPF